MVKQVSKKLKRMYVTKIKNPKTKAIIGWDLKEVKGKNRQEFRTQKEAIEAFKNMNVDARVWVTGKATGKFKYTIVSNKIKGASIKEIRAAKKVFEGEKEVHISVLDKEADEKELLEIKKPKPISREIKKKDTFIFNPRVVDATNTTREEERKRYQKEMGAGIENLLAKKDPKTKPEVVAKKVEETIPIMQKIDFWQILRFILFFLIVGLIIFVIIFCILILSGTIN